MSFQDGWRGFWTVACTAVIGLAFLIWDPITVATIFATIALVGAGFWAFALSAPGVPSPAVGTKLAVWCRSLPVAAQVTAAGMAVFVLAEVNLGIAALVALVAIASSPWLVQRVRARDPAETRTDDRAAEPSEEHLTRVATAEPQSLSHLTNPELCQAWRRSYPLLMAATSTADRLEMVAVRQTYLEEMDRRNSQAFERWLASGARAAGAPDRFLVHDPPPEQSAA